MLVYLLPEGSFYPAPLVDNLPNLAELHLSEVPHPGIGVDAGLGEDPPAQGRSNAIDILEGYLNSFIPRNINPGDSCHLQPCLCLCLGFSQMTITTPLRFITLHFSHLGFTEAFTFTKNPLSESVGNPPPCEIIGGEFHQHPVSKKDPYEVQSNLSRYVGKHPIAVRKLDTEHGIGQGLYYYSLNLYSLFLGHTPLSLPSLGSEHLWLVIGDGDGVLKVCRKATIGG